MILLECPSARALLNIFFIQLDHHILVHHRSSFLFLEWACKFLQFAVFSKSWVGE